MSETQGVSARPGGLGLTAAGSEPRGGPGSPDAAWTTYTVDGRYPARIARAVVRQRKASRVVMLGVVMVATGLSLATGDWAVGAGAAIAGLVLTVVMHLLRPALVRRRMRAVYPPGTVIGARLTPDELWTSGPLGSSQVRYTAFQAIRVHDDVVLLRRRPRAWVLAPVELFGPAGVAWLEQRIGSVSAR